jgi:hypothetical protein
VSRKGRKIDFAQRDAQNRQLAKLGEEFIARLERHRLLLAGRDDLARRGAGRRDGGARKLVQLLWEGVEPGLIPWGVLKGAWRKEDPPRCPNCDGPTILTGWGRVQCGMFHWRHVLRPACLGCEREFEERLSGDLGGWLVTHLDRPLLPVFQVIWGKPNEWEPPGDQGKG